MGIRIKHIHIPIEAEVLEAFGAMCRKEGTTIAQAVRDWMEGEVVSQGDDVPGPDLMEGGEDGEV